MYMDHETYMRRCIQLALQAKGSTFPNPVVGSVIVHHGKIIGEGFHHTAGGPHAEINAICSVENPQVLKDSTIYVSLEPCAHFGRTPPCANKIVEIGFKKVVIGTLDIHEKVDGRGKKIIEDAGIEVISGILEKECRELNKRFFTYHRKKRPYIILKWAQSSDGLLDKDHRPYQIGNSLTRQFVHELRREEHAILVGTRTARNDNPALTTREVKGRNPVRILIDLVLKIPKNFKIYNNEAPTIIFNSIRNGNYKNTKYVKISRENFLEVLLQKLYEEQIQSVVVEGGSFTLQQFIHSDLWDEAIIIKNPQLRLASGTQAPILNFKPYKTQNFRNNSIEFYKNAGI